MIISKIDGDMEAHTDLHTSCHFISTGFVLYIHRLHGIGGRRLSE